MRVNNLYFSYFFYAHLHRPLIQDVKFVFAQLLTFLYFGFYILKSGKLFFYVS